MTNEHLRIHRVVVMMTPAEREALENIAFATKRTMSDVVRDAVKDDLERGARIRVSAA